MQGAGMVEVVGVAEPVGNALARYTGPFNMTGNRHIGFLRLCHRAQACPRGGEA